MKGFRIVQKKKYFKIFIELPVPTGADFNEISSTKRCYVNVLPMCYPKSKNPRKLFTCKGFKFISVVPPGIEPGSRVSETRILSVVLWDQNLNLQFTMLSGILKNYPNRLMRFAYGFLSSALSYLAFLLPGRTR